ncbi:MAG: GNAT family N-acetyltransferase [Flavobacteriales bacterium]|jgi:carbonic anhydrase|tara:strand:- start:592 stop:1059 length:468 start_codon:yes stop_codon:yes gene_type:complete
MEQELIICSTSTHFNLAKKLTNDYMVWLGEDLHYQGIEKELETFHQMYNTPNGAFIYVLIDGEIAGGVGVRKLADGICEMKRLFVYDTYRGYQLGQLLCEKLLLISKDLGYSKMRLDTLPTLKNAVQLYKDLGFYEISKYYKNPDKRVAYMEIEL